MKSNSVLTLQFEGLNVKKTCLKKKHLYEKNLKASYPSLLILTIFFNRLKTVCFRVQEWVKTALSRTLLHSVFKIYKRKITLIKSV